MTLTTYVGDSGIRRASHGRGPAILGALVVVVVAILLAMLGLAPSASASWLDGELCGTSLGLGTSVSGSDDGLGADDIMSQGGKYSAMDLYGSSIRWTTYNGNVGVGDDISNFDTSRLIRGVDASGTSRTNIVSAAQGVRRAQLCVPAVAGTWMANVMLGLAGVIVKFLSIFVTIALNPRIICEDPAHPGGGCINLVGLIGGTGGGNHGIIGTLYQGLYLSLAVVVLTITALWSLFKLGRGQIRNSVFGLVWALIAFVLGIVVLSNPMLLAQAPMRASTLLGSCVTEAMGGRSCLSDAPIPSRGNSPIDSLCAIEPRASASADEHLSVDARVSTCRMWKAFVLEPWSEGQFGMSYESLETSTTDLIKQSPSAKSLGYWKNLKTSMTGNSLNSICKSTTNTYSNVALYQLDLMSDVHDCGGTGGGAGHSTASIGSDGSVYNDWYYMVDLMSQARADTGSGADNISHVWGAWSGTTPYPRLELALVAVIGAVSAGAVIIPVSIRTIGYMFVGTILTAFAPLFMLAGIHPGTGRQMCLGWLRREVGTVLRYTYSILLLSVVVEVYGAILGSSTNAATTLAFVIAMAAMLRELTRTPLLTRVVRTVERTTRRVADTMSHHLDTNMDRGRGTRPTPLRGMVAAPHTSQPRIRRTP